MRERIRLLQVEVRGLRFRVAALANRAHECAAVAFVDPAVEHGDGAFEAVAVFDDEDAGFAAILNRELAEITLSVRGHDRHAGFEQLAGEDAAVHRLPHRFAL